jgi:hypothetical protein
VGNSCQIRHLALQEGKGTLKVEIGGIQEKNKKVA